MNKSRSPTREQQKRRKMLFQRLIGAAVLFGSGVFALVAAHGVGARETDCTALVVTIPLGLFLMFSRKPVIVGGKGW